MTKSKAANLQLNRILGSLEILVEARTTSSSGAWIICIGSQYYKSAPSFVVLAVRVIDNFVDLHRFAVADSELDYDTAKRQAYTDARAFYEDLAWQMTHTEASDDPEPSGMEVIEPDGTKTEWIN